MTLDVSAPVTQSPLGGRVARADVITRAAEIVRSYDTPITLRQLFYRLVAALLIPASPRAYKHLAVLTLQARRAGQFPALITRTQPLARPRPFDSPGAAREWLAQIYRRDRTEGQEVSVYLGTEKAGLVQQLNGWFGALGIPVLPLGGHVSRTVIDEVAREVRDQGRPAVLIYASDCAANGEDIDRHFVTRATCFEGTERVALTAEQVVKYDLPPVPYQATDPRASEFLSRHRRLVQVELDALPPEVLRALYQSAIDRYWDTSAYQVVMERERDERTGLT